MVYFGSSGAYLILNIQARRTKRRQSGAILTFLFMSPHPARSCNLNLGGETPSHKRRRTSSPFWMAGLFG